MLRSLWSSFGFSGGAVYPEAMAYQSYVHEKYTVCGDRTADLIVLMDSVAWTRPYFFWVPVLASSIADVTGMTVCIVCCGGACILRGDFKDMYDSVVVKGCCKCILVMSFGNDIYRLPLQPDEYYEHFPAQLRLLREYAPVGLVYGGTSRMWSYTGSIALDYDENSNRICKACEDVCIYVSKGQIHAHIAIADRIGHVRSRSLGVLLAFFSTWILEFVSHFKMRSRL